MVESVERGQAALTETTARTNDSVMATTLIGAHGLEHMYGHSFAVLVTEIYKDLGLDPIQAGVLSAVRQLAGGITSVSSGFLVDIFEHRRAQVLAGSMALIGLGYFLVSISPTYTLILAALVLASAGSSLWHPPALGLLAQRFPRHRGLFISLHRSTGNIGDVIGPWAAGLLLLVVGWRWIMGGGTPILLILALAVFMLLRNVGGPKPGPIDFVSDFKAKLRSLREAFRGTGMWAIFTVSAVRGMGDRSYVFFLPLYLREGLDKGVLMVAFHVSLVALGGIIAAPCFGALSDRIGRRSIIVFLMAVAVVLSITTPLGDGGVVMTLSVALFGLFHSSVNSLTQAAAIDEVEGRGLDATFMGLLWGSNSLFGVSAIGVGVLVRIFGWDAAFYSAACLFFLGFLASLLLPSNKGSMARAGARAGASAG